MKYSILRIQLYVFGNQICGHRPPNARMSSEQAERYKSQGNAALQAKMYSDAIELYTKAIALDPNCEIYFSNRSAAYAAMERFREALDDAQVCTWTWTWTCP